MFSPAKSFQLREPLHLHVSLCYYSSFFPHLLCVKMSGVLTLIPFPTLAFFSSEILVLH